MKLRRFYDSFDVAPPPTLRIAWTACNATAKGPSPCAAYFPNQPDITGCVRLEFRANETSLECPVEEYEIYRNYQPLDRHRAHYLPVSKALESLKGA